MNPNIGEDRRRYDDFKRSQLAALDDVKAWIASWGSADELLTRNRARSGDPLGSAPAIKSQGRGVLDAALSQGMTPVEPSGLHPSRRRFAPPQDEVVSTLVVRSAAPPRVSNHEAMAE
jgi:hypothetical protein